MSADSLLVLFIISGCNHNSDCDDMMINNRSLHVYIITYL